MKIDKFKRDVKYINKDFGEFRQALINHAKNYFPKTYSDFNESSPGMMLIEMASYVGDVLSFYGDIQLQESFLYTVNEKINLYNLSQGMGYKPKTYIPAQVDIEVMQILPSIGEGENTKPDFNYALNIKEGMEITSEDRIYTFTTTGPINFNYSSSLDPTDISIYSVLSDGEIESYLLKKKVKAIEGTVYTEEFEFGDPKIYDKIVLENENVIISKVIDSDGDLWYEVPYLSQDLVPMAIKNTPYNTSTFSQYSDSVPYLLCFKQTEKRFITRLRKDDKFEIQFGAGLSKSSDELIIPNPYNVGIGLDYYQRIFNNTIDPSNFLFTKTYGKAPDNTTLTVTYIVSNGVAGNIKSNYITKINDVDFIEYNDLLNEDILDDVKKSLTVNNPEAAYGGLNKRPLDTIREEAMAHFSAQNRAVTKEDYILRCYTLPEKYGSIVKAYIEKDQQISKWNEEKFPNPYSMNLYILSFNDKKQFVNANPAIKENLRQYLKQYRMLTDAVNIKDPFIINIGIKYEIITRPNYNSKEVILKCNNRLKELFKPENMEINTPIFINNIFTELDKIEGVQTVQKIDIFNKNDNDLGYSNNYYDITIATRDNIIYPSLDPCIFEIKFPEIDIEGRVIDL